MRRLYPEELLSAARQGLDRSDGTSGLHSRAAAFLARQALEELLAETWRKRAPGMEHVTMRAQLICLPNFLRDQELARHLTLAFSALSQACHYHVYELTPSVSDLRHWIDVVAAFAKNREVRGV